MVFRLLFFCFLFLNFFAFAQENSISGRITDQQGKPIPFASVYINPQGISAIANEEGYYKTILQPGKYTLAVNYIGYKQREVIISLQKSASINIVLEPDTYTLAAVTISSSKEDASLDIIRKVIARRKFLQEEAPSYICEVYTKGVQKLISAPKKILGRDVYKALALDPNGESILYQSETRSRIYSTESGKKELMIASKIAGDNEGFSFNSGLDLQLDFYNNLLHWDALGKSSYVSPVADNAEQYYNYKLIGSSELNDNTIYKIEVIPRHRYSPTFSGDLYILKDDWRLYSVDLKLMASARINFVDTLRINQQFSQVDKNVWKQSEITLRFSGKVLGFQFAGYVNAFNSDYVLNPGTSGYFLKDEIMRIPADVNKKDEAYWVGNRPSPLTKAELLNYRIKDNIEARKQSKPYLDSLQREFNKFRIIPFAIAGYRAENLSNKSYLYIYPLHNTLFYNTVEGWGVNFRARYNQQYGYRRELEIEPNVRYGFASGTLNANASVTYKYNTQRQASFTLKGGSDFLDLNNRGTINLFYNTLTTLFTGKNYLKLYRSKFLSFSTQREVTDGLQITGGAEFTRRFPVKNVSNNLVFDKAAGMLTSNNPLIPDTDEDLFPINNALIIEAKASYTLGQQYVNRPDGKLYQPARYPTIQADYRKGIKNIFNSAVDYDFLSVDLFQDKIKLGLSGYSSFYLSAGKFLNKRSLYYPDIHHFTGNQTAIYNPIFPNFHFLDYYSFSTNDKYFEAHYEHNFSGWFIRKMPFIRSLNLEEIVGGAYLALPTSNYKEVYFGLQRLVVRADYGFSWAPGRKPHSAFRLFYGF